MQQPSPAPLSMPVAADLQDHLLTALHDLERLEALLAHACDALLVGFHGATVRLGGGGAGGGAGGAGGGGGSLGDAITALQFEDLATQLIQHTRQRLRHCADRLALDTMGDDDGPALVEPAPARANPVTQHEMKAGDVELF